MYAIIEPLAGLGLRGIGYRFGEAEFTWKYKTL
jgi:hypothetical protein